MDPIRKYSEQLPEEQSLLPLVMIESHRLALESLLVQSNGLLEKDFVGDEFWALRGTRDRQVTVHYRGKSRPKPFQVMWRTSGDYQKRNGEWGIRDFYRTRSFKHPKSLLKFIQEF